MRFRYIMEKSRYFFERIILYAYFFLGLVLTITIFNSIFHYPEKYRFWCEPISRLGGINTSTEVPNYIGSAIFASGMQICAFVCLFISFAYIYWEKVISPGNYQEENPYHPNRILIYLNFIMAFGAFLVGVPYDHEKWAILHAVGVLLFIGAFCVLNIIAQLHKRTRMIGPKYKYGSAATVFEALLIYVIFLSIIVYIIAFLLDILHHREVLFYNYFNASTQKVVIILCLVALFNLDNDDVLLPEFWQLDHISHVVFPHKAQQSRI